jgi:hypothetical protein
MIFLVADIKGKMCCLKFVTIKYIEICPVICNMHNIAIYFKHCGCYNTNLIPGNNVPVISDPIRLNKKEQKLADLKNWFAFGL